MPHIPTKPQTTKPEEKDPNAKDKFKDLSEEFKDACASSTPEELYKRLADIQGDVVKMDLAKETDTDLINKKADYDAANQPYKEFNKEAKLKTKFIVRCLSDQGKL